MWTKYEVNVLLNAFEENRNVNPKSEQWANIKEYLEQNSIVKYSMLQMQTKFKNMKKAYNVAVDRMRTSGESHTTFEYFSRMGQILGTRPEETGAESGGEEICMVEGRDFTYNWVTEEELNEIEYEINETADETDQTRPEEVDVTSLETTTAPHLHINQEETISQTPRRRRRKKPKTNMDKIKKQKKIKDTTN